MKLNELKAAALRELSKCSTAEEIVQFHGHVNFAITINHRGLEYEVGHWDGWQGDFWLYEVSTGMIFRGTLAYLKDLIITCSAARHEPNGTRHIR
ncbi:hypothetical protein [Pseudomonas phage Waldo5]|uniref:Phage protein n=1 Tax=Pseudomonas phage Waldo5 TaxID=2762290 RepID=A0A7G8LJL2_9CAUD|nr:hypothetical protein [Pseudomonas phage Waldo5]